MVDSSLNLLQQEFPQFEMTVLSMIYYEAA